MRTQVLFGVSLILSAGLVADAALAQKGETTPAACADPCADGLPALVAPGDGRTCTRSKKRSGRPAGRPVTEGVRIDGPRNASFSGHEASGQAGSPDTRACAARGWGKKEGRP